MGLGLNKGKSRCAMADPRPVLRRTPYTLLSSFQPTVFVPHVHWEAHGRGSLPLHHLVSDSANPHYVSDPLPQSCVGSLWHLTALNLDSERWS